MNPIRPVSRDVVTKVMYTDVPEEKRTVVPDDNLSPVSQPAYIGEPLSETSAVIENIYITKYHNTKSSITTEAG